MVKRLRFAVKKYGILIIGVKVLKKVSYKFFAKFDLIDRKLFVKKEERKKIENRVKYEELKRICENPKYKSVFVFYPYTEWDIPIFQRPQQIALELARREDVLYLFCTRNCDYDDVNIYEKVTENLYVTTEYDFISELNIENRIIHLYSTDIVSDRTEVEKILERGDKVLYEYIDEIHEDISAKEIPESFMEKHRFIINNSDCYIVTTADKLYEDIIEVREERVVLSTNGVHLEDFKERDIKPDKIEKFERQYEKLIGYYGAFAKWFDYELVKKVAEKYPQYRNCFDWNGL